MHASSLLEREGGIDKWGVGGARHTWGEGGREGERKIERWRGPGFRRRQERKRHSFLSQD